MLLFWFQLWSQIFILRFSHLKLIFHMLMQPKHLHVFFFNCQKLMYDWLLIVLISNCHKVTWIFLKVTPLTALEPHLSSQHQRMPSHFENWFHTLPHSDRWGWCCSVSMCWLIKVITTAGTDVYWGLLSNSIYIYLEKYEIEHVFKTFYTCLVYM